jgi:CPA2 family monovalent cation:H+ antiporter-2
VLALTAVVVVGNLIGVSTGTFIAGYGVRTSVQAAMSLSQIGEFSFIIAGVGLSLGVIRPFLYPVVGRGVGADDAADAVADTLFGARRRVRRRPAAAHAADVRVAVWRLGERLRATPEHRTAWAHIRRLVFLLAGDVVLLAAIVIAVSLSRHRLLRLAERRSHLRSRDHPPAAGRRDRRPDHPVHPGRDPHRARAGRGAGGRGAAAPAGGARELDLAAAPRGRCW